MSVDNGEWESDRYRTAILEFVNVRAGVCRTMEVKIRSFSLFIIVRI